MVQEFQPCNGDILVKSWVGENGKLQNNTAPAFCNCGPGKHLSRVSAVFGDELEGLGSSATIAVPTHGETV